MSMRRVLSGKIETMIEINLVGDSITVVTSNDLKLAISYSSGLTRPILRLAIEKKIAQQSQNLTTTVTPTVETVTPTATPFPTLKIEGRTVQLPTGTFMIFLFLFTFLLMNIEIKERYGPKKNPAPTSIINNNNVEMVPIINVQKTENNVQEIDNKNLPFSCQNFSEETRKKNTENSIIITSSQKQLGEKTSKGFFPHFPSLVIIFIFIFFPPFFVSLFTT